MSKDIKPIIAIDFDGVIHSYSSGWKGARNIPDPPVEDTERAGLNAIDWLKSMFVEKIAQAACQIATGDDYMDFEVHIFSSRNRYWGGPRAIRRWLIKHGLTPVMVEQIKFPKEKPPSLVLVDDRAVQFNGTFPPVEELLAFKPWNKREK